MIDRGGGSTPPKRGLSLMDVNTRHQVHIEQHKAHITESFQKFLKGMKRDIENRLLPKDLSEYSRARMENLLEHVHDDLKDRYGKYYGVWREQIVDFASYDAEFQGKTMKQLFDVDFDLPSRAQLRSAVLSPITGMNGINNGMTPRQLYADWVGRGVKRVEGIISRGYYQGLTTQQIVREVVGTKSAHYNNGEMARLYRDMETMTRTVVQHAATQARIETLRENDDVVGGLQVVATLDDLTSLLCMSMDGRILDLDTQNLPPYHPGCRTAIVPVLKPPFDDLGAGGTRIAKGPDGSEVVPAETTYFEWLKTQPAEFQDSALGPRRAELLRNGGLTAERFSELNLGRNFEPRTLAEIKALEPAIFQRVQDTTNGLTQDSESIILDTRMPPIPDEQVERLNNPGILVVSEKTLKQGFDDFKKHIENMEGPYREVYSRYTETTELKHNPYQATGIGYSPDMDALTYNKRALKLLKYQQPANVVFSHELAHRYDILEIKSWENKDFVAAIEAAINNVRGNVDKYNDIYRLLNDVPPAFQDILSALSDGKIKTKFGHPSWPDTKSRSLEIFANAGYLQANHIDIPKFDGLLDDILKIAQNLFIGGAK